jgi:hypothetical protein
MNHPEEITPQNAERLITLLGMMGDLGREGLAFLVGHILYPIHDFIVS